MGYKKPLRSVAACATVDELDKIAEHIKDQIRDHGQRPENQIVRRMLEHSSLKPGILPTISKCRLN